MGAGKRFDVFREDHIGFGLRWSTGFGYPISISIAIPFVTFTIGIGREL